MTTKTKVLVVGISLLAAFASGRYLTPVKIKTEIKTVEVERKTDKVDTSRDKHQKTIITEVTKPDGEKEKTTTITEDTATTTKRTDTDQIAKTTDQTKEVTRGTSPITIAAIAGITPTQGLSEATVAYGASVYKQALGPFGVGVWGLTSKTFGASIGVSF